MGIIVSAAAVGRGAVGVGVHHKEVEGNTAAVRRINRNFAGAGAEEFGVGVNRAAVAQRLNYREHSRLIGACAAIVTLVIVVAEYNSIGYARFYRGTEYLLDSPSVINLGVFDVLLGDITEVYNKVGVFTGECLSHYIYYSLMNRELVLNIGENNDFKFVVIIKL